MSALTSPVLGPRLRESRASLLEAAQRHRAQLRLVPQLTAQISYRVFWGLLIAMVIVGTTLLLMLNVTLQNQAFALRTLAAQEQVLQNQEAAMHQELTQRSSSAELAQRAVDLGMVPATSPGFVMLPEGTIVGEPEPAEAGGPYAGLRTPAEPPATPVPAAAAAAPDAATAPDGTVTPITPAAPEAAAPATAAPAEAGVPSQAAPADVAGGQAVTGTDQAGAPSAVRTPEAAPAGTASVVQPLSTAAPVGAASPEG